MKPRLKLSSTGQLLLITDGLSGLSPYQTRRFIQKHYGSLTAFAGRFQLPYSYICEATGRPHAANCTGRIGEARRLLGLPASHATALKNGTKPAAFMQLVRPASEARS